MTGNYDLIIADFGPERCKMTKHLLGSNSSLKLLTFQFSNVRG